MTISPRFLLIPYTAHSEAAPRGDGVENPGHCLWVGTQQRRQGFEEAITCSATKWTGTNFQTSFVPISNYECNDTDAVFSDHIIEVSAHSIPIESFYPSTYCYSTMPSHLNLKGYSPLISPPHHQHSSPDLCPHILAADFQKVHSHNMRLSKGM